jgi:adenylylsulfate kinase
MGEGFVLWLTGLPASGKTSLAKALEIELRKIGRRVEVLDGDEVRKWLSPEAGFTREDRERHLMRVAYVSKLLARNGIIVIASFVSPYREVRRKIRELIEEDSRFIEIYVRCPFEVAIKRDPKGLYRKAIVGEVRNFTGIDDPYEEPENPEITVDSSEMTVEEEARVVLNYLREEDLLDP